MAGNSTGMGDAGECVCVFVCVHVCVYVQHRRKVGAHWEEY